MNSLLDDDDDEKQDRDERELTLSTGTILGIFFGLVLLCGLFFSFGYKMGSHKSIPATPSVTAENSPSPATDFGGFKPAAGSPAGGNASGAASRAASGTAAGIPSADSSRNNAARTAVDTPVVRESPATAVHTAPAAATSSAPVAAGGFVVQIAAVSHQEDAELLVNALRAKGYPVSAHTEPQDKFFHIQVGPYESRKDAETAKQKLVADGYQPIVK